MFKVIIIGDPSCGKTSMLLKAANPLNEINDTHVVTVGVDCKTRMFRQHD